MEVFDSGMYIESANGVYYVPKLDEMWILENKEFRMMPTAITGKFESFYIYDLTDERGTIKARIEKVCGLEFIGEL